MKGSLAVALFLMCGPAMAGEPAAVSTPVRAGDHPGFGRLVFELPKGGSYESTTEGDRLLLVFKGAGTIEKPAALPRNVVSMQTAQGSATLVLTPGARSRPLRMGDRVVVDVLDPAVRVTPQRADTGVARTAARVGTAGPAAGARADDAGPHAAGEPAANVRPVPPPPASSPMNASGSAVMAPEPIMASHPFEAAKISEPPPTLQAAPVIPVQQESLDEHGAHDAGAARLPPLPTGAGRDGHLLLEADAGVAAAAFRRGELGMVVLDRRLAVAPSGIEGAVAVQGAVSTTLQVPLPAERSLKVSRVPTGWTVEVVDGSPNADLGTRVVAEGMLVPIARPGRAVTVLDPSTGGVLLVGTSLVGGPEAALGSVRRTPDYALVPSWLGIVAEPLGDQVDLRVVPGGFLLAGSASTPVPVSGAAEKRRLDLPDEAVGALSNRLKSQLASAAAALPRARTRERLGAVQTMLALGLGPEAHALAQMVTADDPLAAADAQFLAVAAVAAVVANRPEEAGGLDDPRLEESFEMRLWRGLRDRRRGRESEAARTVPLGVALVLSYPETLRRLVWPDVAEAAVEVGIAVSADRLPPFARALALERGGKVDEAVAAYRALENGGDRLDQTRGAVRGAELRLARGQMDSGMAADVMERQAFAWRGDEREVATRLRGAELWAAAGGWRAALDSLRETERLFPEQRDAVAARKTMVFETMLAADGGGMTALDVVLLAADYADCVPTGPAGAALAALLADKLISLDLPARAIPVLQGLMRGAAAGPGRAAFGSRLARLLLDGGDVAGAAAALQASEASGLSAALQEERGLMLARVRASAGDVSGAVAGLVELGGAKADDLRATLLATKGDWGGSLSALADLEARVMPAAGPLPEAAQDVLVREASAATQAADGAALRRLEAFAPRMSGARGDLIRVLTAAPLTGTAELPRAAKELQLAKTIPSRLQE